MELWSAAVSGSDGCLSTLGGPKARRNGCGIDLLNHPLLRWRNTKTFVVFSTVFEPHANEAAACAYGYRSPSKILKQPDVAVYHLLRNSQVPAVGRRDRPALISRSPYGQYGLDRACASYTQQRTS